MFSVDGSSNQQGSDAGIVLEGSNRVLIEQALRFAFKASNNQAKYEALIAGMLLAKEMDAQSLLVKSDLQLVTGQVIGEFSLRSSWCMSLKSTMPELTCSPSWPAQARGEGRGQSFKKSQSTAKICGG